MTKCATFKIQVAEAGNLWVFVGMIKGDTELKIFHSILKYNDFFVTQNLYGNVIAFMGGSPFEGRPWIFKIPGDKPFSWSEVKFFNNPIEMQTQFSQEENRHSIWDTIGMTNFTTLRLPRIVVLPY